MLIKHINKFLCVCNAKRKKHHIKIQTSIIKKSDEAESKLKDPNIDNITAESLQEDLNHYRARISYFSKQIIKATKACNTSIGGLLIIAITMGIFFHNNIYNTVTTVSQAIISINNFLSDDILVDSETFETEPVSEKSNIDSDQSEESEQQHSTDNNDAAENNSAKTYNSECLMNLSKALDIPELSSENYNGVYFGLSEEYLSENAAGSEDDENGIPYADFSNQLTALICSEKTNCLVYADESYQNKVIKTTNDCFDFLDYLDYVYNNPPAYKGTQLWYELLPDAVNLLSFINDQEIFFSSILIKIWHRSYFIESHRFY